MRNLARRIGKLEQSCGQNQGPPQGKEERLLWAINQLLSRPSTAKKPLRPEDSPFLILLEASKSGQLERLLQQLGIEVGEDD